MFDGTPSGHQNPFAYDQMVFEMKLIHDLTGRTREGVTVVPIPSTASEQQVRRMLLEKCWQAGWRMLNLNRIDMPSMQ